MKEIKSLAHDITEELEDAEHYAKCAAEHADDRELSSVYADLSRQELGHADRLHDQAVTLIREKKNSGDTVPTAMQIVWDWEHEKMMRAKAKVLTLLDMVNG